MHLLPSQEKIDKDDWRNPLTTNSHKKISLVAPAGYGLLLFDARFELLAKTGSIPPCVQELIDKKKLVPHLKELGLLTSSQKDQGEAKANWLGHGFEAQTREGWVYIWVREQSVLVDHAEDLQDVLVVIDQDLHVEKGWSPSFQALCQRDDLEGQGIFAVLFDQGDLPPDKRRRLEFDLRSLIGGNELQWECSSPAFPKTLRLLHSKTLWRLRFKPIYHEGVVRKILIALANIDELQEMSLENEQKQKELQRLNDLLAIEQGVYHSFVEEALKLIGACREEIYALKGSSPKAYHERFAHLFRMLHTLKGSAGLFNFTSIQNRAHEVESTVSALRAEVKKLTDKDISRLIDEVSLIEHEINEYRLLRKKMLGGMDDEGAQFFSKAHLLWLLAILNRCSQYLSSPVYEPRIVSGLKREIQSVLMPVNKIAMKHYVKSFEQLAQRVAKNYDKKIESLDFYSSIYYIDKELATKISELITHCLTNAVSHGIEAPSERLERGKPEKGGLAIRLHEGEKRLKVIVEDDGKGIDPDRIAETALQKGILSEDEIEQMDDKAKIQLIFAAGFSGEKDADLHRGRGVGMGAVREMTQSLNGQLSIESKVHKGTRVVIDLPFLEEDPLDERSLFLLGDGLSWCFARTLQPFSDLVFSNERAINQLLAELQNLSLAQGLVLEDLKGKKTGDDVVLEFHFAKENASFFALDQWFMKMEYFQTQADVVRGSLDLKDGHILTFRFRHGLPADFSTLEVELYASSSKLKKSLTYMKDYFQNYCQLSRVEMITDPKDFARSGLKVMLLGEDELFMPDLSLEIPPQVVIAANKPDQLEVDLKQFSDPILVRSPLNRYGAQLLAEQAMIRHLLLEESCLIRKPLKAS